MTRRADHDKQRQARVLSRYLAVSGRTQTEAAFAGAISYPHFRRFLDGRTPLRDDMYASVARAVGVTERELRLAMAEEAEGEDEQAPEGWDLRAELEAGVPLKEVSEALGHANVAITAQVYTHVLTERRRRAAGAIGAVLVPKPANGTRNGSRESG